jgi:hypothetical protein
METSTTRPSDNETGSFAARLSPDEFSLTRQRSFESLPGDGCRLPYAHSTHVGFVDLGDHVHAIGTAQFDQTFRADFLAGVRMNPQDPPVRGGMDDRGLQFRVRSGNVSLCRMYFFFSEVYIDVADLIHACDSRFGRFDGLFRGFNRLTPLVAFPYCGGAFAVKVLKSVRVLPFVRQNRPESGNFSLTGCPVSLLAARLDRGSAHLSHCHLGFEVMHYRFQLPVAVEDRDDLARFDPIALSDTKFTHNGWLA